MIVTFKTKKLNRQCNTQKEAVKAWGERRAKLVRRRLDDLRAATTLEDMRNLPGDCHAYKHREDHILTLDLDGGWRLYFRPTHDPPPLLADGVTLDWTKVTEIEITGVKKAHE